jgi:hypothetical protein
MCLCLASKMPSKREFLFPPCFARTDLSDKQLTAIDAHEHKLFNSFIGD